MTGRCRGLKGRSIRALLKTISDQSREGYRTWFAEHRAYLRPDETGLLTLDRETTALGVAFDSPELFEVAIAALDIPGTANAASRALARFAPTGPVGQDASAWSRWHQANKPYLFFSEWGQYRWYVDRLAQERGVPTAQLRGAARASR